MGGAIRGAGLAGLSCCSEGLLSTILILRQHLGEFLCGITDSPVKDLLALQLR